MNPPDSVFELASNLLKSFGLDDNQLEFISEVAAKLLIIVTVIAFLYGSIFYPEPHSIVVERLAWGIGWALLPSIVCLGICLLLNLAYLISLAAIGVAIVGSGIAVIVFVLSRPTFW